mgnify:CR=1 FL=1
MLRQQLMLSQRKKSHNQFKSKTLSSKQLLPPVDLETNKLLKPLRVQLLSSEIFWFIIFMWVFRNTKRKWKCSKRRLSNQHSKTPSGHQRLVISTFITNQLKEWTFSMKSQVNFLMKNSARQLQIMKNLLK